jgi:hypothetical protein
MGGVRGLKSPIERFRDVSRQKSLATARLRTHAWSGFCFHVVVHSLGEKQSNDVSISDSNKQYNDFSD